MKLYRNVIVPVPSEASVSRSDRRVYITTKKIYDPIKKYNRNERLTIGRVNDDSLKTMNPNDNYRELYPALYEHHSNGKLPPASWKIGMYSAVLAAAEKLGLYSALTSSCGPQYANAVLDYASYSIRCKSNTAQGFEQSMHEQLLFSEKLYSDSWYGEFFNSLLNETIIEDFKRKWLQECKNRGVENVWLCIDGSNNDCSGESIEIAEPGHAKSKSSGAVYSFMYAVSSEDGMPVTFSVERGGKVDSKSFKDMYMWLQKNGFHVEGIIIDRGFCNKDVIQDVISGGYRYLIMMKGNIYGFTNQLRLYGKEIKDNAAYLAGDGTFACTHEDRIFQDSDISAWITLVYESINGGETIHHLTASVRKEIVKFNDDYEKYEKKHQKWKDEKAAGSLRADQKEPLPPELHTSLEKYIDRSEDGRARADVSALNKAIERKGFYGLACSEKYSPEKALELYDLRDASEKQFMILKTQLGCHCGRSHCDEGIAARHMVAFTAGIIRNQMSLWSEEAKMPFSQALHDLNHLKMKCLDGRSYQAIKGLSSRQKSFLEACGLDEEALDYFAQQQTRRVAGGIYNQVAKLPEKAVLTVEENVRKSRSTKTKAERAGKSAEHSEDLAGKSARRGRPAGSPNKRDELDDIVDAILEKEKKEKRKGKRGRPPGAKNKPREDKIEEQEKGGRRGRPAGAKNRRTMIKEELRQRLADGVPVSELI